jgi:hypothetical protein
MSDTLKFSLIYVAIRLLWMIAVHWSEHLCYETPYN